MRKHHIRFRAPVEMFRHCHFQPLPDVIGKRRADFNLFA
jgi:hypothetical protein